VTHAADLYDAVLMDYAVGALPRGASVVVAAHLAIRPRAARWLHALEAAGAEAFEDEAIAPMEADAAHVMARAAFAQIPTALPEPELPDLGAALVDPAGGPWRTVLPGMRERAIPGLDATFIQLKAGRTVPRHGHEGLELTLVLHGMFEDDHGAYHRGDLVVADENVEHRPRVPKGIDCICLSASLGRPRPSGLIGRLWSAFN